MPQLINQAPASAADSGQWQLATESLPIAWVNSEQWQSGQPLCLQGDEEPQAAYLEASHIAIEFPAFNDGRGLSLAVLLRTRLGYTGEIRAVGAVHEDILHYMVRCGFTSFELPDDRDPQIALGALSPYSDQYQASVTQPKPAFRRTQRGG